MSAMTTLQQILTLASSVLPFLAAALTFLVKFVKNEKAKRALQQAAKLTEALGPLVVKAEQFTHFSGEEKKEYVLTLANQFAIEQGISFDRERVSSQIEEIVETTKLVNTRSKTSVATI